LPRGIRLAGDPGDVSERPRRGGAVRLLRPGASLGNFNPAAFAQDYQITGSYLEPLLRPNPSSMRPEAWLATTWEWGDQGRALSLHLRDDVTWHDGSPFSAHDAVFSFDVYRGDVDSAVAGLFALVASVEAASEREVLVKFHDHDPTWLFNAATLPVFSKAQYAETWDALPESSRTLSDFDWSNSMPMGTGPWRVAGWEQHVVTYSRHDAYWGAGAWLDELEIAVEPGVHARLTAWRRSVTDLLWPVRLGRLAEEPSREGVLHNAPAASVMFAAFNFANPAQPSGSLWTDLRVRRAMSLAIDRERYAQEVFDGFAKWHAAGTIAQPWAHDSELVNPVYNPEWASMLLAEAGWVDYDGDGVREDPTGWQFRPVAILREDSRPELAAVLARVANDLAAVGGALTVESLPPGQFDRRWIQSRDYDLIAYAYDQLPGFTDFDLYGSAWDIRTNPVGWNPGGYNNPLADAAIEAYLEAVSIERQSIALRRLQHAVDDDLFGLWFGFPNDLVLVAEDVKGFSPDIAWQTLRTWELWRSPG
jgi:peptide/nickel transport system substrate-binding protein